MKNATRWSPLPQLASNRWSDHHHRAAFPHALMAALHATALDCCNMTGDFALIRLDWLCIMIAGSPVLVIQRPIVAYDHDAKKRKENTQAEQKEHKNNTNKNRNHLKKGSQ